MELRLLEKELIVITTHKGKMKKKLYVTPCVRVTNVKLEGMIAGSTGGGGGFVPGGREAKDDNTDWEGWDE